MLGDGKKKIIKKSMKWLADFELVITNEEINTSLLEETVLGHASRRKMYSHHLCSNRGGSVAAMQGVRKALSWRFAH